jgi:hypothetical protein
MTTFAGFDVPGADGRQESGMDIPMLTVVSDDTRGLLIEPDIA